MKGDSRSAGDSHPYHSFTCLVRTISGEKQGYLPDFRGNYALFYLAQGRLFYRSAGQKRILAGPLIIFSGWESGTRFMADLSTRAVCIWCSRRFLNRALSGCDVDRVLKLAAARESVFVWPLTTNSRDRFAELFATLQKEFDEARQGFQGMIGLKLLEFFLTADRMSDSSAPPYLVIAGPGVNTTKVNSTEGRDMAEIAAHIAEHYSDSFNLGELAERCGLNPSYFSRLFKEQIGKPVFEFINNIRVEKACALLKRTDMTVIDIAYSVGYNNVSFFNRYFRKLMNMPPMEYRSHVSKE